MGFNSAFKELTEPASHGMHTVQFWNCKSSMVMLFWWWNHGSCDKKERGKMGKQFCSEGNWGNHTGYLGREEIIILKHIFEKYGMKTWDTQKLHSKQGWLWRFEFWNSREILGKKSRYQVIKEERAHWSQWRLPYTLRTWVFSWR